MGLLNERVYSFTCSMIHVRFTTMKNILVMSSLEETEKDLEKNSSFSVGSKTWQCGVK